MGKYLNDFNAALKAYSKKLPRPGYVPQMFTSWRHSFKAYPHIEKLRKDLEKAEDDKEQKRILKAYFKSPKTTFNNHSFSMYLLDQLTKTYPDERWIRKNSPKEKKIVFYTGMVYRGTLQKPFGDNGALVNGMWGGQSGNIEAYASDTSRGLGLSTSKHLDVAKTYQNSVFQTHKNCHIEYGYLYEINYRGLGGVDILETHKARENHTIVNATSASHKAEVNIIGRVLPKDIVGYWDPKGIRHENDQYEEEREIQEITSQTERLEKMFAPRMK